MANKSFNVAIDGPAGAGKSTVAKAVAKKMGIIYVDTGAMYRAMALNMIREKVDINDAAALSEAASKVDISLAYENGTQKVLLNGEDVSGVIRTEEVSAMASKTSVNPDVRTMLVKLQQKLAAEKSVVMDGRDIGTVVLPKADVKVYLTAGSGVRAKRRYDELKAKGEECDLKAIEEEIIERDHRDMTREISPLKQAEDAVFLDTSDLTIQQAVDEIMLLCLKAEGKG